MPTLRQLFPLAVLAGLCLSSGTVSPAQETRQAVQETAPATGGEDDFIRFAEDDRSARLELAVRTFRRDDGNVVDLVGVVHIADEAYYQELNRRLAGYDVVLYELVGDPAGLAKEADESPSDTGFSLLRFLYGAAGKLLRLTFQLQHIDYSSDRFVHADVSHEEFERLQNERGESFATLMARAMEIQKSGPGRKAVDEMAEFNPARLLFMMASPRAADEFKIVLARLMAGTEDLMAKAEEEQATVILTERNGVALAKLREVLDRSPGPVRAAVFYGAAHMPGIGRDLRKDFGFQPDGAVWLSAWTMPRGTGGLPPSADSQGDESTDPQPNR